MSEAPAPCGEEADPCPLFCSTVGSSGIPLRKARCQLDRCEWWKDGRCSLIGVLDMMMVQLPPTEDSEPPETSETEGESPLRVVCAWCGKVLEQGEPKGGRVSGGICPPCAKKHFGLTVGDPEEPKGPSQRDSNSRGETE